METVWPPGHQLPPGLLKQPIRSLFTANLGGIPLSIGLSAFFVLSDSDGPLLSLSLAELTVSWLNTEVNRNREEGNLMIGKRRWVRAGRLVVLKKKKDDKRRWAEIMDEAFIAWILDFDVIHYYMPITETPINSFRNPFKSVILIRLKKRFIFCNTPHFFFLVTPVQLLTKANTQSANQMVATWRPIDHDHVYILMKLSIKTGKERDFIDFEWDCPGWFWSLLV